MQYQLQALVICTGVLLYAILRRRRRLSTIRDVPGPVNPSWIFGHRWHLQAGEAGEIEKRFLKEFGNIVRWNGPFGEDRLWVVDPKAINHILQKSGYLYAKPTNDRERAALVTDPISIVSAEGDTHKRLRRVMAPAFGVVEVRALVPQFTDVATKLADKWTSIIENSDSGHSAIVDMNMWIGKAALDVIGTGTFDYDFGALDGTDNPLTKSYTNIIFGIFKIPSQLLLFFTAMITLFPGLLIWLSDHSSDPGMRNLQRNKREARRVARELLDAKRQELKAGVPGKDIMSVLVKSSLHQHEDRRLTDEEIISQLRVLMLAGHDTTAKTLTWGLWELAKHRDCQEKLRAEINETLDKVKTRGDIGFTANDFDIMPYLVAVTKETLRIHPVLVELARTPIKDDVLPLTKPIVGTSGRVYAELPIPKGTTVILSTTGYNLNPDLWSLDASEFRPERWFGMNEQVESPVGMYGNLSTFSGGVRSCIGWRFAVLEIQTSLVTLIQKFDISQADHHPQIRRARPGMEIPMVVGEEHKGVQLPLKITAIGNA